MSHSTPTSWLAQFESDDRDFRFMATSDLLNELKKPAFSADESMQKRLSTAVLKLLRDPSSEVQGLAMKCLPLLAARVSPNTASSIAAQLSVHVLPEADASTGKSSSSRSGRSSSGGGSGDIVPGSKSLRDVAGLALKSMVATLPPGGPSAEAIVSPLASRLLAALPAVGAPANSWLAAGVLESLELLADVLLRFPRQLVSSHSKARDALLPAMTLTDASVRRRAVAALAALAATASLDTLGDITRAGIAALESSPTAGVALVSALARSAGRRLVPHLGGIVPPLVSIASVSRGDDDDDGEDFSYDVARDEQREVALTALDSLVRQVPGPMAPYVSDVLPLALALSKHDPNYTAGGADSGLEGDDMEEDVDGSGADVDEDDEDGFREDEGDYSDDEDASWKVRRAAVRLCHALVQVARVMAAVGGASSRDTYVSISQALSARFTEREEVVKLDIFDAFSGLLAVIASPLSSSASRMASAAASTAAASAPSPLSPPASGAASSDLGAANAANLSATAPSTKSGLPVVHVPAFVGDADVEAAARAAAVEAVTARAGRTLRSLRGELHASRNGKSRAAAAAVLRRLVTVASPATVAPRVASLVGELCRALGGSSAASSSSPTLRIEALLSLNAIVRFCGPTCLAATLPGTVSAVLDVADDRYYKVTAESLRLCEVFVDTFGPSSVRASLSPAVTRIYEAAVTRLSGREQDSEVKAAALRVVAATFSQYGTELDPKSRADAPRLLLARLTNEVTRTPAIFALSRCCGSTVPVDADVQQEFASMLGGFLRKTDRSLRLAALDALTCLASTRGGILGDASKNDLAAARLPDVAALVGDGDPRVAALSLGLAATVVKMRGSVAVDAVVSSGVFPASIKLVQSPLLQGTALEALLDFISALAVANASSLKCDALLLSIRSTMSPAGAGGGSSGAAGSSGAEASGGGGGGRGGTTRLQIQTAARCVAAVVRSSDDPSARVDTMSAFVRDVHGGAGNGRGEAVVFALAVIAEVGRCALIPRECESAVWAAVLEVLGGDGEEELKTAAATALGAMAGGALSTGDGGSAGVQRLVTLIRERPSSQRYLLLLAVKEAVASSPRQQLAIAIPLLLPLLVETVEASGGGAAATVSADVASAAGGGDANAEDPMAVERAIGRASETGVRDAKSSGEESIRTATAECLGMLAAAQPQVVVPWLVDGVKGTSSTLRAVAVTAVKYAVSGSLPSADDTSVADGTGSDGSVPVGASSAADRKDDLGAALTPVLSDFLGLVGVRDLGVAVRKGALQTLGALARWRPALLREYLRPAESTSNDATAAAATSGSAPLLSRLFGETEEDKSLVRMVDLGPFRVKEDGGLELRKAALGAIITLLHTAPRSLPGKDVADVVSRGLRDGHADVGPLATSTLQAALAACSSAIAPAALVSGLRDATPLLATALGEVLFKRVEENAVRQEVQRQDEAVRGALRALRSMLTVDALRSHPAVVTLVARVRKSATLLERWLQACGDADANSGAAAVGKDTRGDLAMTDS
ncbi:hypothetical protein I4F81_002857 [Pyropia yezoensis]|uniref:Uncharacterized protein n=1 Tax=Pyropia yezoensis TaxID=2788 RepID=A0ACC3BRP7_PYRYE|nr:hypothetical protein I4F81_002857 [Neopyropia yezoensis]|eukprot:contig_22541_g5565